MATGNGAKRAALQVERLGFTWPGAAGPVLDIPALSVAAGESVFLRGRSGSGKSTLLAAISGVIDVGADSIHIAETDLGRLSRAARDRFRGDHIGVIFQLFNLVPYLSALDNVTLPCRFSTRRRERAAAAHREGVAGEAARLLQALDLGESAVLHARATELSVGQQQRVAAARALIGAPGLVLADEPTSALDEDIKGEFIDLLLSECRAAGASLLFVSHDRSLEGHFDRSLDFSALNRAGSAAC